MNSRRKGARLEREAAHALRSELGLEATRSARNGVDGAADLDVPPGARFEVKGRRKIGAMRFMDQARVAASQDHRGSVPVVMMREDAKGWVLMIPIEHVRGFVQWLDSAVR